MTRNYFDIRIMFFFAIVLLFGCSKDIKDSSVKAVVQNDTRSDNNGNSLRLTHIQSEFGDLNFTYNQDGLVDRLDASYYNGYFKHQYNEDGRLIIARFYSLDDLLQFRIEFFYDKNEVVHEIWYNGDTWDKNDEVFYTFDNRGLMTRAESFMLGYHATYKYSAEANMLEFTFYLGDNPFVKGSYTYLSHLKNPYSAISGRTYDYYNANGFFDRNKWYSTSQYFLLYDEQGNAEVLSDQDPAKTIQVGGPSNYVTASNYYESLDQTWIHFTFTYDKSNNSGLAKSSGKMTLAKIFERSSIKSIREKVKEFKLHTKSN
jgi:hypothetical protein